MTSGLPPSGMSANAAAAASNTKIHTQNIHLKRSVQAAFDGMIYIFSLLSCWYHVVVI